MKKIRSYLALGPYWGSFQVILVVLPDMRAARGDFLKV